MSRETIGPTESSEAIDYSNVALVAPGQGSQRVGMGWELHEQSRAAKEVFKQVDDALGFPLSHLMFYGPEDKLKDTANAQPAVYTLGLATFKTLEEQLGDKMIMPKSVAGHSVGIYATLPITGMLDIGEGAKLVRKRGELMQKASLKPQGTMAAIIGLNQSDIEWICEQTGVELANINTDEQMVISGKKREIAIALDFAHKFASSRGIKIRRVPLPVSGGFHSSLMEPAKQGLQDTISKLDFGNPKVPIIANSLPRALTTAYEVKDELVEGLCLPVNWRGSVRLMANQGIKTFIELGPNVLTSMVERIDANLHAFPVDSFEAVEKLARSIQHPANRRPLSA